MASKEKKSVTKKRSWQCECGQRHTFDFYAMAHWDIPLIHTCGSCGREHELLRGKKTLTKDV